MNINDVDNPEDLPSDLMQAIFDKQSHLMHKYHPIEEANGLLQTPDLPVNLHDKFGQARIKDMAWRMTEEFTEATECMEDNREHYLEEMVDALHFFVELCLHADFYPSVGMNEIPKPNYFLEPYDVIEQVGLACNCLKNKPWKQTHMLTDIPKFRGCLNSAWVVFIQIFLMEGLEPVDIYNLYFRKNAVNQFRQRSKY